ncbi:hypothetical protein LCI18_005735 [Fusarium solani-melongenae]|uniref:Uncharacterized protein n=1 Tax=Fusarium solani subsp. cucurbitae TaxID=2747967 RepID=A0ACD3Z0S8_FUSSC|nr:hypothetical protein LCI18_005735 [Fusarium solani-melongenae]
MSFRGYRSRAREPQSGGLDNFRSLRTFRVSAFVFHLGLSLLESPRSREALYQLISKTYQVSQHYTRKTFIWTGNIQSDRERTQKLVDSFLSKCRASQPNLIVSDRIAGEGLATRLDWPGFLDATDPNVYSPKWAATFRINKMLVDGAVAVAEAGNAAELQKHLFLLSLSVAHELVHMLMGYIAHGESGRYWENAVFGCFIEAYHDSRSPTCTCALLSLPRLERQALAHVLTWTTYLRRPSQLALSGDAGHPLSIKRGTPLLAASSMIPQVRGWTFSRPVSTSN